MNEAFKKAAKLLTDDFITTYEFKTLVCKHCDADCIVPSLCKYLLETVNSCATVDYLAFCGSVDYVAEFMQHKPAEITEVYEQGLRMSLCTHCSICQSSMNVPANYMCKTHLHMQLTADREDYFPDTGGCLYNWHRDEYAYYSTYSKDDKPSMLGTLNAATIWKSNME